MVYPAALGLALLGAALARGALARHALGAGPLAWAGRVSYSAYLYHLPLLYLAGRQGGDFPAGIFLPGYALAVAAASWASWRFIEARFASGIRRPAPPRSPAPATPPRPTAPRDSVPHP